VNVFKAPPFSFGGGAKHRSFSSRSGVDQLNIAEFLKHVRTLRLRPAEMISPITAASPGSLDRDGASGFAARRTYPRVDTHALFRRQRRSFLRAFVGFSARNVVVLTCRGETRAERERQSLP